MAAGKLPVGKKEGAPLEIDLGQSAQELVQAKTVIGYGESGTAKTTNARHFARWLYATTGRPVRLISFEDSSKLIFQPLIDTGIVEALFITKSKNPAYTMRKLSRGGWPVFGREGVVNWQSYDAGKWSGYVVEGLTSASDSLLEECRENHRFPREQKGDAFTVGGEKFTMASQTSYGFVQQEMIALLKGFASLGGIERVLWTAHEAKGMEDGQAIRGPGLAGNAKTHAVQRYCGVLLHFDVEMVGISGALPKVLVPKYKVWFRRHPDPVYPKLFYPAKTTLPPETVTKLEEAYPGGYFEPNLKDGLDKFLTLEGSLVAGATESMAAWKKEIDAKFGRKA